MRWVLLIVIIGLALSTPGAASAAKPEKDEAGEKKAKDHPPGYQPARTDDKLNLFKGTLDLTIWTIAVFLILFWVLSTFAWPQIRAGLDKRETDIAHDRAEADKAKKEAEAMRNSLAAEMAKAHEEARRIVDKAVADARSSAAEEVAKGKADLQAEKERLHNDVARERDQALQEIWSQGAQLAALISSKAIGKSLSEADHRALLSEALDEFKASAQSRVQDLLSARS
jgi:F-type H+-transporting ATPase subunit b